MRQQRARNKTQLDNFSLIFLSFRFIRNNSHQFCHIVGNIAATQIEHAQAPSLHDIILMVRLTKQKKKLFSQSTFSIVYTHSLQRFLN